MDIKSTLNSTRSPSEREDQHKIRDKMNSEPISTTSNTTSRGVAGVDEVRDKERDEEISLSEPQSDQR